MSVSAAAADGGVEQALLLHGGAAHDRGGLPHERGVAQQPPERLPRLQVPLAAERLLAPAHAVDVHDVDPEQQHALAGCRPPDRVEHGRARARQQVVVVVELHDPLAGGDLDGAVHVLDQAQRRPVPDVPVSAGPAGQEPSDHVAGGVVVGPVGHGHLDVLGHRRDRADDRAQRPLQQSGRLRVGIVIDSGGGCMWFTPRLWRPVPRAPGRPRVVPTRTARRSMAAVASGASDCPIARASRPVVDVETPSSVASVPHRTTSSRAGPVHDPTPSLSPYRRPGAAPSHFGRGRLASRSSETHACGRRSRTCVRSASFGTLERRC